MKPELPSEAIALYNLFIHGEISRRDFMDGVQHDHAFGNFRAIIHELSAARITMPDSELSLIHI